MATPEDSEEEEEERQDEEEKGKDGVVGEAFCLMLSAEEIPSDSESGMRGDDEAEVYFAGLESGVIDCVHEVYLGSRQMTAVVQPRESFNWMPWDAVAVLGLSFKPLIVEQVAAKPTDILSIGWIRSQTVLVAGKMSDDEYRVGAIPQGNMISFGRKWMERMQGSLVLSASGEWYQWEGADGLL